MASARLSTPCTVEAQPWGPPPDGSGACARSAGVRAALALAALLACAGPLASCAKRAPPSGGPPDVQPPRLVSSFPDSGAAGVPREASISLTFSEGMEPRSTGESVSLAPRIEFTRQRWSGRTLTLELAQPLEQDQTYTLVVGGQARDRHGNPFGAGATVVFSTAASFPPGAIEGRVEARGFPARGTALWCYDASLGRAPDSTARDFDAIGIADEDGGFRVAGLAVPGRYRLWAFADLDGNRSFEPERDILFPVDTTFALDRERPRASGVALRVFNPRAPTRVSGTVLDTLGETKGTLHVWAVSDTDSTHRVVTEVQEKGGFEIALAPGLWWLRAFRDLDKNGTWKPLEEPASETLGIRLEPADEVHDVVLVLRRPRGVP